MKEINKEVKAIKKRRFLLSIILTFIFLSANLFGVEIASLKHINNNMVVYAAGSRASSSGVRSGSFKSSTSSPKSSSSTSKSSSGGVKSGSFSNSSPKSSTTVGSSKSSSSSSDSGSSKGSTTTNNYNNYSSPRSSFLPIPIIFPWFSSGSYFGGASHSVGNFFGDIFKFIVIVIIIIILFNLFRKSKR